jgi:8-oxo-dGTP pyrophosphatase MutT (NUDIX family)
MIVAGFVLFQAPDGRVLLLRRSETGDHVGEWDLPGGKVEGDENVAEAAIREVKEEIGLTVGLGRWLCRSLQGEVDATTFIHSVNEEFVPQLNEEHTDWVWVSPVEALQPMSPVDALQPNTEFIIHPGISIVLRRLKMNEYEVSEAIRDGELTSPQWFENALLVDVRISGTGISYRPQLKEWVYRRPENYLTPDFLKRTAGMPIIYEHPEDTILDSRSFGRRVVGTMQLSYVKNGEVWGVARIYDHEAGKEMIESGGEDISTSPSVVFRDPTVNYEIELMNGETMLVEGSPSYLDHLAICLKGVWDKGGEASGIRIDSVDPRLVAIADSVDQLNERLTHHLLTRAVGRLERRIEQMEARDG